uniref:Rieske domain-containing protein n=1 Tax=Oncorhynchus mykiss TaxID=8022 RepID=A0A8C7PR51_ONCMY
MVCPAVEVKVELTLLEKDKEADVMSPNGKASPFSDCRPNGALGHCSDEDAAAAPLRLYKPRDYVEASVCHVKDMENGQMREVDLGSGRALLIKEHGEFSAIGHKCPHYGAPLVKGVLSKGHVRCPWHGACFSIATGDIEDFPGLDSLPTFQVTFLVRFADLQSQKRSKAMARCSATLNQCLVPPGPAGLVCAETLRQEGFTDRIVMCTMDKYPPYDRPKLSKVCTEIQSTPQRLHKDYPHKDLAVAVDVKVKAVTFQDGSRMEYRRLFIATGSKPKPLNYKGQDVRNVFHLRTPEDANNVARLANNKNAVIVGTSFVGMEVAAALTDKAHSVSIIGIEAVPFRKALGEKVGKAIMKVGTRPWENVVILCVCCLTVFVNVFLLFYVPQLKEVVLKSGKVLRADVCIIGTGSGPATGFLKQSGVHMDSKGFVPVNKTMQTNIDGVYAGGDIVTFPFPGRSNKKVNIPHWQMAHVHGRVAALGMMGRPTEIKTVPYFWSAMFGKSLRYAGYGEGFDDVVIQGDVDELKFVAFYTRSEEVVAVASMNYDPIVSRVAEVLGSGKTIRKRDVETGDMSWLIDKGSQ